MWKNRLSFEQRQGQINFYLIWPRLNLIFIFFARTPLRMSIEDVGVCWDMIFICVSHFKKFFLFRINESISSEVKYDELNFSFSLFLFSNFTFSVLNPFMMIFCCWTSLSKWLKKHNVFPTKYLILYEIRNIRWLRLFGKARNIFSRNGSF